MKKHISQRSTATPTPEDPEVFTHGLEIAHTHTHFLSLSGDVGFAFGCQGNANGPSETANASKVIERAAGDLPW